MDGWVGGFKQTSIAVRTNLYHSGWVGGWMDEWQGGWIFIEQNEVFPS